MEAQTKSENEIARAESCVYSDLPKILNEENTGNLSQPSETYDRINS